MDRRTYLALTGAVFGLAGCVGDNDENDLITLDAAATATETETETESDPASFEIIEVSAPSEVRTGQAYTIEITVRNTGGQPGTFEATLEGSARGTPGWDDLGTITVESIPAGETETWISESFSYQNTGIVQFRLGGRQWSSIVTQAQPDVQLQSHELVTEESEYTTEIYVAAVVENTGQGATGGVGLTVNWFDGNGDYIDDSDQSIATMAAGETWAARIYTITDPDRVADYELTLGDVGNSPTAAPALEVSDTRLLVGDNNAKITGTVRNTGSDRIDSIDIIGKFYDADDTLLFTESALFFEDLAAEESSNFEIERLSSRRLTQIEDYEVVLGSTTF
ncbi:FxLYD domain-containing protein [Halorhabdus rudnickae]|uniref:FxLYD domain-containing protein n=1 Tax=Halorhabdus rudnickae TaxID=1775544 RepID=UPI0010825B65|nr:FxLYD domain-containing protein [Halorhabdus rudnickae]